MLINIRLTILMIILRSIASMKTSAVSYNQPKFCPTTRWNSNATTFGDINTVGSEPAGIFINTNNTIYVANREKNQIVIWYDNSSNPTSTVSGGWPGLFSIFVTTNGDIYVDNCYWCSRADKWLLNTNIYVPVMSVKSCCYGLFIDINNTLYCSMRDRHQVVEKWLSDNGMTPTTAVGTGTAGSNSNQLDHPYGIFVDVNFDLYVADCYNHRIQLFRSDQRSGTTAVGDKSSSTTITLKYPTGVVLDGDKYLFIVDQENHRIVRSSRNGFMCLVGCSGSSGFASDQINNPRQLSFDSFGNMFVTDWYNSRVQKFLLLTNLCDETTTSQAITTSTKKYVPSSTTIETVARSTNTKVTSDGRGTTIVVTIVKLTSAIGFNSTTVTAPLTTTTGTTLVITTGTTKATTIRTTSIVITRAAEMTTTGITKIETTSVRTMLPFETTSVAIRNKPSSDSFNPPPCPNSKRIGSFCNISNSACNMMQPCQNNGTCYDNDIEPHRYVCLCLAGFSGTQCQCDHRPCKLDTCWHNGTCNETSNTTFICDCQPDWEGIHCEIKINYCKNVECQNNGVCRPLIGGFKCECLGESFSGEYCAITATKIRIYQIASKSFAYVAIIALISAAMFIVIMDILKYCFGIDPVEGERARIRRKKQMKKRKPVIQRFIYVNAPTPSPPEKTISTTEEITV